MAALRKVRDPATGEVLDAALVLWLPAPRTETGEDMAEVQLHGGPAIVRAVLSALSSQPGCRLAEPGEFARRAFEHGKIDLAQAEGLADLIEAETEAQRRQAVRQMGGALSALYEGWRLKLIEASALVEFGDRLFRRDRRRRRRLRAGARYYSPFERGDPRASGG